MLYGSLFMGLLSCISKVVGILGSVFSLILCVSSEFSNSLDYLEVQWYSRDDRALTTLCL